MQIVERWRPAQDSSVLRPYVTLSILDAGQWQAYHFIVDSGADETMMPAWTFPGSEDALKCGETVEVGGINRKPG